MLAKFAIPSASPRSSLHHSTCVHSASLFHAGPHTPLPPPAVVSQHARRLFLVQGSHPFLGRPFFIFLLAAHCAVRDARRRPHARTLARARTDDRRTNDATCGPQAWLTLGRIRSVRSPLRRAPLLASPIAATPLQLTTCNAAAPKA